MSITVESVIVSIHMHMGNQEQGLCSRAPVTFSSGNQAQLTEFLPWILRGRVAAGAPWGEEETSAWVPREDVDS